MIRAYIMMMCEIPRGTDIRQGGGVQTRAHIIGAS